MGIQTAFLTWNIFSIILYVKTIVFALVFFNLVSKGTNF